MQYVYEDLFLRKKVDDDQLLALETKALEEADKLGITDPLYREQFVKTKVYTQIAIRHLEGDGMREKYDAYKAQCDEIYRRAKSGGRSNLSQIATGRG